MTGEPPPEYQRGWLRYRLGDADYRMAVHAWRPATPRRCALYVHGFLGCGLEFERLAAAMAAEGWLVLCPDLPGYGDSDWLPELADYGGALYRGLARRLIASSGFRQIDLIGASMGAALALRFAAEHPRLVRRLVLNDGGAFASAAALTAVLARVPSCTWFADRAAAEAAIAEYRADCDRLPPEDWRRVVAWSLAPADGGWRLRYDPRVVEKLRSAAAQDQAQWEAWSVVDCPTLLIRGMASDMMPQAVAARMLASRPGTQLMTVPDCGHRPWLRRPNQVAAVLGWLSDPSPG